MRVTRVFESEPINKVLNHPAVLPWVCGPLSGYLDMAPVLANHKNILLMIPSYDGGFLFCDQGKGVYEVHTQFTPKARGLALDAAKSAAAYMFNKTPCVEITTCVPVSNRAARALTLKMGFKHVANIGTWLIKGREVPTEFYSLTKEQYLCRQQSQSRQQ